MYLFYVYNVPYFIVHIIFKHFNGFLRYIITTICRLRRVGHVENKVIELSLGTEFDKPYPSQDAH